MQKTIAFFSKEGKGNSFIPDVDINLLDISDFNPRKTVDEKHI